MTLDELIELMKKPNFEVKIDTNDLLAFLIELKESRILIKQQAQYIENHLSI